MCTRSVVSHLSDPVHCSPPGSSVHEIFQARILEWVAISHCRGSSTLGTKLFPVSPALVGRFFTTEPPGASNTETLDRCLDVQTIQTFRNS